MCDKNDVNKLVEALDKLCADGSGHINVAADEEAEGLTVKTVRSADCGCNQGACMTPTIHKGFDE